MSTHSEPDLFHKHLLMRLSAVVRETREHEAMLKAPQKLLSFSTASIEQFLSHCRREISLLSKAILNSGGSRESVEKLLIRK
jgi:site-specific recombinase